MFLAREDEARLEYLHYRGKNTGDNEVWKTAVLKDFAELHVAKLTHPLMNEIERAFAKSQ